MTNYLIRNFTVNDDGAVTVDWVVLTAVIVTLGIAVISVIAPALSNTTSEIATTINVGLT